MTSVVEKKRKVPSEGAPAASESKNDKSGPLPPEDLGLYADYVRPSTLRTAPSQLPERAPQETADGANFQPEEEEDDLYDQGMTAANLPPAGDIFNSLPFLGRESNIFPTGPVGVGRRSYVFLSGQGGAGKSTLLFNVVADYARRANGLINVLVMDLSQSFDTTRRFLGDSGVGQSKLQRGARDPTTVQTFLFNAASYTGQGDNPLQGWFSRPADRFVHVNTANPRFPDKNVYLLPANHNLHTMSRADLAGLIPPAKVGLMAQAVIEGARQSGQHWAIFINTDAVNEQPESKPLLRLALNLAEKATIVMTLDDASWFATETLMRRLADMGEKRAFVTGFLVNRIPHTHIERSQGPPHPTYGRLKPPHERTFNLIPQSIVPQSLLTTIANYLYQRFQQDDTQSSRSLFAPEVRCTSLVDFCRSTVRVVRHWRHSDDRSKNLCMPILDLTQRHGCDTALAKIKREIPYITWLVARNWD